MSVSRVTIKISIHTLRVEGDLREMDGQPVWVISIHTLRVEGDFRPLRADEVEVHFYPHPPCGG